MPAMHAPLDDLEPRLADRDDSRDDSEPTGDDREHAVAHRVNPLPAREEDEEELAEADILHELDLDDEDIDLDAFDPDDPDRE